MQRRHNRLYGPASSFIRMDIPHQDHIIDLGAHLQPSPSGVTFNVYQNVRSYLRSDSVDFHRSSSHCGCLKGSGKYSGPKLSTPRPSNTYGIKPSWVNSNLIHDKQYDKATTATHHTSSSVEGRGHRTPIELRSEPPVRNNCWDCSYKPNSPFSSHNAFSGAKW